MNEIQLKAAKREGSGKSGAKQLRKSGQIPGICYGAGKDTTPFAVNEKELSAMLRHGSDNTIIHLDIAGEKQNVIIREIQRDYLKDELLHIDVTRISMTEKIEVEVAVELAGEPVGVKDEGGVLDHALRSVHLKCLPTDIPENLSVDVSGLAIGDTVRVSDIAVDTAKIEILTDPEAAVASVSHAMSDDDLKVQLEDGAEGPEVIGEDKEEGAAEEKAEGGDKKEEKSE